jgi:hypothetical protein
LKTFVEMPLTELVSIVVRDGGASALRTVDFLAVGGLLPVQSLLEEAFFSLTTLNYHFWGRYATENTDFLI